MRSKKNRVGSAHRHLHVSQRKLSSCAMRRSGFKNESRVLRQKARADEMPVALMDDEPRRLAFRPRGNGAFTPQVPLGSPLAAADSPLRCFRCLSRRAYPLSIVTVGADFCQIRTN